MNDLQAIRLFNYSLIRFSKIWQHRDLARRNLIRMFLKHDQKNIFILLLISLLITFSATLVFAQNPSTQIEIDFSQIQGVSAGKENFLL